MQTPFSPNKNATELGIDLTRKFQLIKGYSDKFKVGDVMVFDSDGPCHGLATFRYEGETSFGSCSWSDVAYADEQPAPKFKVGDGVSGTGADIKGWIMEVYEMNGDRVEGLKMIDGSNASLKEISDIKNGILNRGCDWSPELKLLTPQPLTFKEGGVYRVECAGHREVLEIKNGIQVVLSSTEKDASGYWSGRSFGEKHILEDLTGKEFEHYEFKNPAYFGEEKKELNLIGVAWEDIKCGDAVCLTPNGIKKAININQPQGLIKKTMSNVIEFAKNMNLSVNEKALRKAGLHDDNGNWTNQALLIVEEKKAVSLGYKSDDDMLNKISGGKGSIQYSQLDYHNMLTEYYADLLDIAKKFVEEESKKK